MTQATDVGSFQDMDARKLLGVAGMMTLVLVGATAFVRNKEQPDSPAHASQATNRELHHAAVVALSGDTSIRVPVVQPLEPETPPPSPASRLRQNDATELPVSGVRSFFFCTEAWEGDRILSSKTFNPRGVKPTGPEASEIALFAQAAARLIGPMTKQMQDASTKELLGLAAAGLARRDRPPQIRTATVDGVEVTEVSLSRPKQGDVQVFLGKGGAHVATWAELPNTKQTRADLALTIMEHLVGLARLLESHAILSREEADRIVFAAVEIGSSYS